MPDIDSLVWKLRELNCPKDVIRVGWNGEDCIEYNFEILNRIKNPFAKFTLYAFQLPP